MTLTNGDLARVVKMLLPFCPGFSLRGIGGDPSLVPGAELPGPTGGGLATEGKLLGPTKGGLAAEGKLPGPKGGALLSGINLSPSD